MAESRELLLLGMDKPSSVFMKAVCMAVGHFAHSRPVTIRSSLAFDSLITLQELKDQKPSRLIFDTNWDPQKTAVNLAKYNLNPGPDLMDFAKSLEAEIVQFDESQYFEDPALYEPRVQTALMAPFSGFQVVVTPPSVIGTCLKLMENQRETEMQFALVEIAANARTGVVLEVFKDADAITEKILSTPLSVSQSALYSSQILNFSPALEDLDRPVRSRIQSHLQPIEISDKPEIPPRVKSDLRKMMEGFQQKLHYALAAAPKDSGNSAKAELLQTQLDQAVSKLDQRLTDQIRSLRRQADCADQVETALKNEMKTLLKEVQAIVQNQEHLKRVLDTVLIGWPEAIKTLIAQVRSIEDSLPIWRSGLASIMTVEEKQKPPPFFLENVIQRADTRIIAPLKTRKQYLITGLLQVTGSSGVVYSTQIETGNGNRFEFDIGSTVEYSEGEYQICVYSELEQKPLSNVVTFAIDESRTLPKPPRTSRNAYDQSLPYRTLGNLQELEHQISATSGPEGLDCFRRLSQAWVNEDQRRLEEFVQCFLDHVNEGEAFIRAHLTAAGFQLQ